MAEATTDRRVRRTRQLLRDALVELTLERGYDRVTIQDILDRADVGRSTFYAHYRDKDDLLVSEFEALHPTWGAMAGDPENGQPPGPAEFLEPFRGAFEAASTYRRTFKAMIGRQGAETVRRLLPEPLSKLVRDHVQACFPAWRGDERALAAATQFIVSAYLGMLTWWLDTDAQYTPDEIFGIFKQLAGDGSRSFFGSEVPAGPR
ncbi:MAG: TetR/AcrR family transcriptional regulator [Candidatus Limnocylindrales bacterium]|jgi:AcrR family transcriptional regulator